MASNPDLDAEQAYLDRVYQRLDELRSAAAERLAEVIDQGRGGTHQARTERDVVVASSLARTQQLDVGDRPMMFGRIDFSTRGNDGAASYHIGRFGVSGADQEPLVVDWRAPVAEPFYRATARHPMGLERRRHIFTEGRRVVGVEDEIFSLAPGSLPQEEGEEFIPSGALLAALESSRSGRMRDIVATIQEQQDEVVRAPLSGVLVVQGGPGTGKTAVALHRAAYLLYTHRFPLERQGMLVVGPNQVFLRYISQVLPSLGESGAILSTVDGLVSGVPVRAGESASLSRLKGDARMSALLRNALRDRERPLREDLVVPYGSTLLRMSADATRSLVGSARSRRGLHNSRRSQVREGLSRGLVSSDSRLEGASKEVVDEVARRPEVVAALDRMWPLLTGEELVHDLFGAMPLLRRAARGLLDHDEVTMLFRDRSAKVTDIPWTVADASLVDEARSLLGPVPGRPEAAPPRTYGHLVLDEAQDLSAMALRALSRRSLGGSMTVVGDLAQAVGPSAPSGWEELTRHLRRRRTRVRMVELEVNYRTPAPIMDLASRVLAAASPALRPPRSARSAGEAPRFFEVASGAVVRLGAAVAADERASIAEGTVGVVCPTGLVGPLVMALGATEEELGSESPIPSLDEPVSVVPVPLVKGIEFDSVVVVEPQSIVEEGEGGLRSLYVALTRATRRLSLVYGRPLPTPLALQAAQVVHSDAADVPRDPEVD